MGFIKRIFAILVLPGVAYLTACQETNDIHITTEQFIIMKDTIPDAVILDVRTESEYNAGHLKGARLISIGNPDFTDQINRLDRDLTYFVYCRSGARSSSAVHRMRKEGFQKAYNIKGGIIRISTTGVPLLE